MQFKRKKHIFFSFALVLGTIVHCFHLGNSIHPSGWDGYYYVMQVQSVFDNGYMQSVDYSLIYPLLYVIGLFSSNYILVVKIGVVVLVIGFISTIYSIFRKNDSKTGWLLLVLLIFSPCLTYVAAQFPKNLLGVIFLLLFLKAFSDKNYMRIACFFLLTLFSHRLTAGVALLLLTGLFFNFKRKFILILVAIGITILTIGISVFPGIIHIADLQRFEGEFSVIPSFAPVAFLKSWNWSLPVWWWVEIILHISSIVYLLQNAVRIKSIFDFGDLKIICLWVATILCFPFFVFEVGSMGYRFYLLSLLFTPFLVAMCVATFKFKIHSLVIIGLLVMSISSYQSYDTKRFEPNWNELKAVAINAIDKLSNTKVNLVIAHQGLAELIIINSEIDALNWAPDSMMDMKKIYRVVSYSDYYDFSKHLSENDLKDISRIGVNYYLMSECVWKKWLMTLKESNEKNVLDRAINPLNPMRARPLFLKK